MNDAAAIQQWIDMILDAVQELIQAGEELPDEVYGMIADAIMEAQADIERLQGQGAGLQQPIPELQPGAYPSSNVNSYMYNPKNEQLFVKFHGKDSADSGPIYRYANVPKFIYDVFSRGAVAPKTSGQNRYHKWVRGVTPSLGASLYALIKQGGYNYDRLT